MDDKNHEQRPRASLRGKGHEILLGQRSDSDSPADPEKDRSMPVPPAQVDASSLSLTPEETEALLDFSATAPAYESMSSPAVGDRPIAPPTPMAAPAEQPVPLPDWLIEEPAAEYPEDAGLVPETEAPAWWDAAEAVEPPIDLDGDAVPLAERESDALRQGDVVPYQVDPRVDALVPGEPEIWSGTFEADSSAGTGDRSGALQPGYRADEQARAPDEHEGGLVIPEGAIIEEPAPYLPEPFELIVQRQTSKALFDKTTASDPALLNMLVNDERIRTLAQQIDALQEELALNVHSDRGAADVFHQELLRASSLLLASRENYDDARAIVYRVRTDMNRQHKVDADIMRYRPLLLNYYVGWGIALGVLFLLRALFSGVTEAIGVEVFSALYYPMLFGIVGALISGYLTLERHTTRLRDFDPIHVSWYLFNPLLGGVMGLLMFLLASIANEDLLQETASEAERAITYLLCVVAGMNQNHVLRQLNDLLKRVGQNN